MVEKIDLNHSLYTIYLRLNKQQYISVGKLGVFSFQEGTYIYVGSAKKNIQKRIERHKKIEKKKHWHLDYLRPFGVITRIITYDQTLSECELVENIRKKVNGVFPIKGFGSSDCNCMSHLIFIKDDNIQQSPIE